MANSSAFRLSNLLSQNACFLWVQRDSIIFDSKSDHGLRGPQERQSWLNLLLPWLPANPAIVLDIGCGTGTLNVLLAEQGQAVTGIERAPAMLPKP